MKSIRLTLACLLLATSHLYSQTADQIIDKHISGIGGKNVIRKIKTQVIESTEEFNGVIQSDVITREVGMRYKNVAGDFVFVINLKDGWMTSTIEGNKPLSEEDVEASKYLLSATSELVDYKSYGHIVELIDKTRAEGMDVYRIKMTRKDGRITDYYIDTKNYYIIKEVTRFGEDDDDPMIVVHSDYRKTDIGFYMAFKTFSKVEEIKKTTTIQKVQFNVNVDAKIFEMPKK